jgi:hypothetical protein
MRCGGIQHEENSTQTLGGSSSPLCGFHESKNIFIKDKEQATLLPVPCPAAQLSSKKRRTAQFQADFFVFALLCRLACEPNELVADKIATIQFSIDLF